jgi:hypothetical protein
MTVSIRRVFIVGLPPEHLAHLWESDVNESLPSQQEY